MSLPHRGFYIMDEQMVPVNSIQPFIHMFEGTWANRCCCRLPRTAWLAFRATGKTVLTAGF